MGSSRRPNSTRRAIKARSVKLSPKPRRKPTPGAMKKRLETRKPATGLGTATVNALRVERDGIAEGAPIKVNPKLRDDARRRPVDDEAADLFAILHELAHAISVVRTAKRSLEHRDSNWDEIVTLEGAITRLRQVDMALNDVADGRPSRIKRPDDSADTGGDK
jgi:hypothetical protein